MRKGGLDLSLLQVRKGKIISPEFNLKEKWPPSLNFPININDNCQNLWKWLLRWLHLSAKNACCISRKNVRSFTPLPVTNMKEIFSVFLQEKHSITQDNINDLTYFHIQHSFIQNCARLPVSIPCSNINSKCFANYIL